MRIRVTASIVLEVESCSEPPAAHKGLEDEGVLLLGAAASWAPRLPVDMVPVGFMRAVKMLRGVP